jgi:type IV pilus assembly protein PilB
VGPAANEGNGRKRGGRRANEGVRATNDANKAEIWSAGGAVAYHARTVAKRIGELLVEAGVLSQSQLEQALFAQRKDGRKLGQLLIELGLVSEVQLTQTLSRQLSVPWVSLYHVDFSRSLLNLVSREIAERYAVVPILVRRVRKQGETLYVAMDDPTNEAAIEEVARTAALPVKPMIACPSDIRAAIRVYYFGETAGSSGSAAAAMAMSQAPAPRPLVPVLDEPIPVKPVPKASGSRRADTLQGSRSGPRGPTEAPAPAAPASGPRLDGMMSRGPDKPSRHAPREAHPPESGRGASEAHAPETSRGPDSQGLDSWGPGPEGQGAESRGQEGRGQESRPAEGASQDGDSPDSAPDVQAQVEDLMASKPRPKMISLTLLDGTTISIPAPGKKPSKPDIEPPKELSDQLTARDLVSALRAVAHGVDASEILGTEPRWEAMFSALLSILLRKGLIADWEFVEEFRKI